MKKIDLRKIRRRIQSKILGSIPDRILVYLSFTELFRLIRHRAEYIDVEINISISIVSPLIVNIIKLLKWKNDNDYEKLLYDIENKWVSELNSILARPFYKRMKYNDYYEWLYEGPIGDDVTVIDDSVFYIGNLKDDTGRYYKDLPIIRTNEEVLIALEKFMDILSQKLSKKEYMNVREIWDKVND
ncbi:MAG: hypothetical protein KAH48_08350 [Chlorobi bacterium]|nr:hypothetical protein [Chlorobiota bacterium]